MTLGQIAFEFVSQFGATIVVHVESLVFEAHHTVLLFLNGETRVDEQRGITFLAGAHKGHETSHTTHHGAHGGNTTCGINVKIDKSLDETGSFGFEFRSTVDIGVNGGHAILKRFDLGIHTDFASRKSRNTHFHSHKLLATGVFNVINQTFHFTDGGSAHFLDAALGHDFVNNFCWNWSFFHHLYV